MWRLFGYAFPFVCFVLDFFFILVEHVATCLWNSRMVTWNEKQEQNLHQPRGGEEMCETTLSARLLFCWCDARCSPKLKFRLRAARWCETNSLVNGAAEEQLIFKWMLSFPRRNMSSKPPARWLSSDNDALLLPPLTLPVHYSGFSVCTKQKNVSVTPPSPWWSAKFIMNKRGRDGAEKQLQWFSSARQLWAGTDRAGPQHILVWLQRLLSSGPCVSLTNRYQAADRDRPPHWVRGPPLSLAASIVF